MPRLTNASPFKATSVGQTERAVTPRALMSDAERAARSREQIAAGQYLEDDGLDAFLDSLQIPATKA
jgi:hypothetical protein